MTTQNLIWLYPDRFGHVGAGALPESRPGPGAEKDLLFYADLVVLNDDPIRIPSDEIKDVIVEMTILNGEIAWERAG